MKYRHSVVIAGLVTFGIATASIGAGIYQTLPIVAEPTYCASTVTGIGLPNAQYGYPGAPPNTAPGGGYGVYPGSTQGTGVSLCAEAVPAGPTGLTGNEILPADMSNIPLTSPTFVGTPATAAVPVILLDSGAYTYSVPNATRANFTVTNPTNWLILDGTGTLTQINVQLPGTAAQPALNGQQFHLVTAQPITTLGVVGGTGTTITLAPGQALATATTSGSGFAWIYDSTTSTWYRFE